MQAEQIVVFESESKVQVVQFDVAKLQEMHAFTLFNANVASQLLQSTAEVPVL